MAGAECYRPREGFMGGERCSDHIINLQRVESCTLDT
jgi:hypothetical protein